MSRCVNCDCNVMIQAAAVLTCTRRCYSVLLKKGPSFAAMAIRRCYTKFQRDVWRFLSRVWAAVAVAAKTHWPRTRFEGLSLIYMLSRTYIQLKSTVFLGGNTMGFSRFVIFRAGRKLLHRPPRSTSAVRLCNAYDQISRHYVTSRCQCILSKLFRFLVSFFSVSRM